MPNNIITSLYGIDYTLYGCGGRGNSRLFIYGKTTSLFPKESDMLKELARLKELEKSNNVGDISVFVTPIIREEYQIIKNKKDGE